jgi:ABC-type transport system involved in multi-copper enzyme maturation permease subunit
VLRFAGVFIMVVFVASSMSREASDKLTEFLLSQPIPRWVYFTGKLLGYLAIAASVGLAFAIPMWITAPLPGVLHWTFSLLCELAIMTAVGIFLALSFSQAVTAISAAAAFYLLSRSMHNLQLMAAASLDSQTTLADQLVSGILNAVAFVLPALDRFAQSAWLISPPDSAELLMLLGQTAIYIGLISMACLFDLYRKNF